MLLPKIYCNLRSRCIDIKSLWSMHISSVSNVTIDVMTNSLTRFQPEKLEKVHILMRWMIPISLVNDIYGIIQLWVVTHDIDGFINIRFSEDYILWIWVIGKLALYGQLPYPMVLRYWWSYWSYEIMMVPGWVQAKSISFWESQLYYLSHYFNMMDWFVCLPKSILSTSSTSFLQI